MTRRIIEIFFGLIITIALVAGYTDETHPSQLLIWYVFTPAVLKIIVWIALFFAAGRLLFGRRKDYSAFFLRLLNKWSGKQ